MHEENKRKKHMNERNAVKQVDERKKKIAKKTDERKKK